MTRDADVEHLLARFAPRLDAADRERARAQLARLTARCAGEPADVLAGRASVVLAALLAPVPAHVAETGPPSTTALERARTIRARRAAAAPPELSDGLPIGWSGRTVDREAILGLWRARRAAGPRRGERLFGYVHLPFCRARCAFCQFETLLGASRERREALVRGIEDEARALLEAAGPQQADAVTLGGGTPSELEAGELARVLAALEPLLGTRRAPYTSAEVNPDSAHPDRIAALVRGGIARLSMGVQSMHAPTLHAVARGYQSAEMVREAVATIRAHVGVVLGLDLMASLPEETEQSFVDGVEATLALGPDELVLYRYQPVLRGATRTIEPGSVTWPHARARFEALARAAGYALAPHTGSSIVARRPQTPAPPIRYVQHPNEPTSMLGLGPFAESHVFGRARYLSEGVGSDTYRMLTMTDESERALLTGRRLAAGLPIHELVLEDVTGAALVAWRGEVIGALLERGEMTMNEADRTIAPALSLSAESRWALLDARTLRALAGAGPDEPVDGWRDRLGPVVTHASVGVDDRREIHERAIVLDDLLVGGDPDALASLLTPLAGPAGAVLAHAIFGGMIDPTPTLRIERDGARGAIDESLTLRVRVPSGLGSLADEVPGRRDALRELVVRPGRTGVVVRVALDADAPLLTALANAVARARLEGIEALLEHGADGSRLLLRAQTTDGSSLIAALAQKLGVEVGPAPSSRERAARAIALEVPCDGSLPRLGLRLQGARLLRAHATTRRRLPRA